MGRAGSPAPSCCWRRDHFLGCWVSLLLILIENGSVSTTPLHSTPHHTTPFAFGVALCCALSVRLFLDHLRLLLCLLLSSYHFPVFVLEIFFLGNFDTVWFPLFAFMSFSSFKREKTESCLSVFFFLFFFLVLPEVQTQRGIKGREEGI